MRKTDRAVLATGQHCLAPCYLVGGFKLYAGSWGSGGGVVTHVYVSLGELPVVLVANSLLLDLVLLPALGRCSLVLHGEPRLNVTYALSCC